MATRQDSEVPAEVPADDGSDHAFDKAREGLRATGASEDTRELVELLARHGREEGRVLAEYETLVQSAEDRAVRYLGQMVLADERRHHAQLAEMATSLAWDTWEVPGTPSTPPLPLRLDDRMASVAGRLLAMEEADKRELQRLRKRLRPFADTTLWGLLVDLMLLDTEKHAAVFRFLVRHADGD